MANWIAVVDDDSINLKTAGHILSKNNMRVTVMKSGQELLDFVKDNKPDLILLDILMPGMDGFETLERLRKLEKERQSEEIPVIFLTADEDKATETRGFDMGVSDFIRKPFDATVFIKRINNILVRQGQLLRFHEEATRDKLTGLLNKGATNEKLEVLCTRRAGFLMMIDLDSFKLVNDLYGHEMGDRILLVFAGLIRKLLADEDIIGRMGGDEFTAFSSSIKSENDIKKFTVELNTALVKEAKVLMGENMDIPLGASVGVTYVTGNNSSFKTAFRQADKALYEVKKKGKHGYAMFNENMNDDSDSLDLTSLSTLLSERNVSNSALLMDRNSFGSVYRFVMRYIVRYHRNACKMLFTLTPNGSTDEKFKEYCDLFGEHTGSILRKSDLMMQCRNNQYFILLTDIKEDAINQVVGNIIRTWNEKFGEVIRLSYEIEFVKTEDPERGGEDQLWVVVVDDDMMNLRVASRVLEKNDMKVTSLTSGKELLKFVRVNRPDLILLDVKMPEMDGFETLERLRAEEIEIADIPVVFLTSDEEGETEKKGLSLGAMDFIKKPFVPEVLTLRVKQIVELLRLQKNLSDEVARKTRENEQMFLDVVSSLAGAIDAKDTYTNGHSSRVAEYSREIAKRYGYNTKEQGDIYIMALLHDVGKIGVPDAVINKNGRLTDEEFELIKTHPVVGHRILKKIKGMPRLSIGARWHHERYGGGGYPDGLVGEEIPEEARIIAVADAYDAMTSYRSYRDVMPREKVRSEIETGKGTQFDPRFADIMLKMMDEDKDFRMREMRKTPIDQL